MAIILSGKTVRDSLKIDLVRRISLLKNAPELCIISVGENPESEVYINQKKKFGESIGVIVNIVKLDQDVKEGEIIKIIKDNNESDKVNGIIVQLPLPENLNNKEVRQRIINSILPEKDVDGLGIVQKSKFYNKDSKAVLPATARGIVSLLDFYREVIGEISGKNIVVVGRSDLVGKPTALSLLYRDATVTICHSKTRNLENITKNGDFLVIACGVARLIGKQHVREGQIVIDVGIHKTKDGLCGDCDFEEIKNIVKAISPVPGGVGPLSVLSLFQNIVDSAIIQGNK